jgi:hypothetical protein
VEGIVKKKNVVVLLVMLVAVFVTACGSSSSKSNKSEYADKDFYVSLEKGLTNRWKKTAVTDKKKSNDITKSDYAGWVEAEYKQVSKYRNMKFKNSNLQEVVIAYINALKGQKDSLKYWSSDSFEQRWGDAYDKRTVCIAKLNKIQKIKVSKKNQESLSELLGNASDVSSQEKVKSYVSGVAKKMKFTQSSDEDGYKTYQAVVQNTSKYDFKTLWFNVKLLDADGVTIDTPQVSTDDWTAGSKVRFEFSTDKQFKTVEVSSYQYELK